MNTDFRGRRRNWARPLKKIYEADPLQFSLPRFVARKFRGDYYGSIASLQPQV